MKLIEALQRAAWGMEPEYLRKVAHVIVQRHLEGRETIIAKEDLREYRGGVADGNEDAPPAPYSEAVMGPLYNVRNGVAVIGVGGILNKYSRSVDTASGGRGMSYERLRKAVAGVKGLWNDGKIHTALFHIDSPGGEVSGVEQLATDITDLRESGLRTVALADDTAASCAYWIGSQCGEFYATPLAMVGAIGVFTAVVDSSRWAEDKGFKVHLVRSGPHKGVGMDGVPISAEEIAGIQAEVDALGAKFKAAVIRGRRGLASSLDKLADGRAHVGSEAVRLGLADGVVQSAEKLLAQLQKGPRQRVAVEPAHKDKPAGGPAMVAGKPAAASAGTPPRTVTESGMLIKNKAALLAAAAGGLLLKPDAEPTGGDPTNPEPRPEPEAPADPPTGSARAPEAPQGGEPVLRITRGELDRIVADGVSKGVQTVIQGDAARRSAIAARAQQWGHIPGMQALVAKAQGDTSYTADKFAGEAMDLVAKESSPVAPALGAMGSISVGADHVTKTRRACVLAILSNDCPDIVQHLNDGKHRDRVARRIGFVGGASEALKVLAEVDGSGLRGLRPSGIQRLVMRRGVISDVEAQNPQRLFRASSGSTSDWPNILRDAAHVAMMGTAAMQETTWQKFCKKGSLPDFKTSNRPQMSNFGRLRRHSEKGSRKNIYNGERNATNRLYTYTGKFGWTREMQVNDELGAFLQFPILAGKAAMMEPEFQAYELLIAGTASGWTDAAGAAAAFFSSANANILTTAGVGIAALQAARVKARKKKDFKNGEMPVTRLHSVVIVPTEKEPDAYKAVNSEKDYEYSTTSGDKPPNPVRGRFEIVDSPLLADLTGGSSTRWYTAGKPSEAPAMEVAFLDGREEPIINSIGDGSILEESMEIVHDCGVAFLDPDNMATNAGA